MEAFAQTTVTMATVLQIASLVTLYFAGGMYWSARVGVRKGIHNAYTFLIGWIIFLIVPVAFFCAAFGGLRLAFQLLGLQPVAI